MVDWIKRTGSTLIKNASNVFGSGVDYVSACVGKTRLFGSTEASSDYDGQLYDEKHYFLVPDRRSGYGYSLYVMRCLPDGVPPINDLEKRRLVHLPNQHALTTLEQILVDELHQGKDFTVPEDGSLGSRIHTLADQIDQVDDKMFNGVLLIGGLVALINPLAGVAIAAKAMIPSIGMVLAKNGLRIAGDSVSKRDAQKKVAAAEKALLQQFKRSNTDSLVNPLLEQFDRALATKESEYDPLLDFDLMKQSFTGLNADRLRLLSYQALANTYDDMLSDHKACEVAQLGPEDIRYLMMIRNLAGNT